MAARKRYSARMQAVRCAGEAIRRKHAGETMSAIHEDLKARGEITMALRTFMQWINRFETDAVYVPLEPQVAGPVPEARTTPAPEAGGMRHARLGTPLPSMPNTTPDMKALFGDDS